MSEQEEIQYMYNILTPNQQIAFFSALMEHDFDIPKAFQEATRMGIIHDELEAYIGPHKQFIVGNDYYEYDITENPDPEIEPDIEDVVVENVLHLYSNKRDIIDEHVKMMFESVEILTTVSLRKNHKLRWYRCLKSLNFENRPERPIIPLNYN